MMSDRLPTYTVVADIISGNPQVFQKEVHEQVTDYDYESGWFRMYHPDGHEQVETSIPAERINSIRIRVDKCTCGENEGCHVCGGKRPRLSDVESNEVFNR